MQQRLLHFLQILTTDFFIGYGLYSLLFLLAIAFVKKTWIRKMDETANQFIAFVGIVYLMAWIATVFVLYYQNSAQVQEQMLHRMFGKYWFGFWLQPLLWFGVAQLLRYEKVYRNVLSRIVISLILMVSIERFVILVTSLHRDYLPSSWVMYNQTTIDTDYMLLGIFLKVIMFLAFTGIYYVLKIRFTELIYSAPVKRVRP